MKKLWLVFSTLLLIGGLVFMGCPGETEDTPETGTITWALSQDGTEDGEGVGTKTTTEITITFSRDVTGLRGQDVTLSTGNVTQGALSGSGKVWKVAVTVQNPGNVSVEIGKEGIETGPKTIRVIKEGTTAPITYEAVADGTAGTTTSTKITFTFDKDVTGLVADDITITPAGTVTKGALTGSGKIWTLALSAVNQEGDVTVKITKEGIDQGNQTVKIHMAAITSYKFYLNAESKLKLYFEDYLGEEPTAGETYTISLDFGAFDSRLVGCHFGGQVFGEVDDDDDEELAGWANGNPATVEATPRAYSWRFTIKDPIPSSVTGKAYFQLMAQVPAWGDGLENAEEIGFNATVTIAVYVPPNLEHNDAITIENTSDEYDYWEGSSTPFKGALKAEKSAEIKAFSGGVLRFYITGTIGGGYQASYGIGSVGPDSGGTKYEFGVPSDAPTTTETYAFEVDVPLDEFDLDQYGRININIWAGTITKVEVWTLAE